MELCKGSTLLDEVLNLGSYTADTARLIFSQVPSCSSSSLLRAHVPAFALKGKPLARETGFQN